MTTSIMITLKAPRRGLSLVSSLSSVIPKLLDLPATFSGDLQIAMDVRGVQGMSPLAILKLQ
jgi:hypothetical protein